MAALRPIADREVLENHADELDALRNVLLAVNTEVSRLAMDVGQLWGAVGEIKSRLQRLENPPPADPGKLTLRIVGEDAMAGTMLYEVDLPTFTPADDVHQRVISLTVDDVSQDTDIGLDATVFAFKAPQGSRVKVTLTYFDDGTPPQASVHPSELDFAAMDTVPPSDPGGMNLRVLGEE